jgi:hypothetical protein
MRTVIVIYTPGGVNLHRNKRCPRIRNWIGLNTSPYVNREPAPTAKAGYNVCPACLPAKRLTDNWTARR